MKIKGLFDTNKNNVTGKNNVAGSPSKKAKAAAPAKVKKRQPPINPSGTINLKPRRQKPTSSPVVETAESRVCVFKQRPDKSNHPFTCG